MTPGDLVGRVLDGHVVVELLWATDKMAVFRDESGNLWRYMPVFRKAWPVSASSRPTPSAMPGDELI